MHNQVHDYYITRMLLENDRHRASRRQRNAEFADALKDAPSIRRPRIDIRPLLTMLLRVRLRSRQPQPQPQPHQPCTAVVGMHKPMR